MMTAFLGLEIPSVEDLGGGSAFQAMICLYSIALYYEVDFYYVRPMGIFDPENVGIQNDEWDRQWNDFFNLADGAFSEENTIIDKIRKIDSIESIPELNERYKRNSPNYLLTLDFGTAKACIDKNISMLVDAVDELGQRYSRSPKPDLYFDSEAVSVALHVRRFSKADTDPDPIREYFHPDQGQKSYYHKMMYALEAILRDGKKPVHYHIYTQGDLRDFEAFLEMPTISRSRVFIHSDESPFEAIHHMANADIFVMAKSSLSWVAMVYASGKIIGRKGFWHKTLPSVCIVDARRPNKHKIGKFILDHEVSLKKSFFSKLLGAFER